MSGALDPRSAYHAAARTTPRLRAVPDPHPEATFGPQHAEITALISAVAGVTPEQDEAIETRWFDLRGPGRFVARGRASEAASAHGRLEAQFNARQRAWSASALKCRDAAGDAAHALAVRDLIGGSFDRSAYDELVAPWATVMGPVHPEDAPVVATTEQ
ncbi:hypothetical protein [Cumulibacter manganitolerans]|uniref:hypothetical protein n=1 Tax=Cumulibacter manganitolerans TaxID=1884992 RepID=UPI0012973100|nr:hypothetical protein [Cumulibacter manganitolerans]